jgi:hypothetical protein
MITPGPDGTMWFTENANPGAIARISLPPLVRDIGVRRVNTDTAIVTAIVSPNAQETELEARYGAGESYRGGSTDSVSAGAGWDKAEVSLRIDGLRPGKTYRFRIAATNDSGTDVSQSREFTTNTLEPELAKTVVAEPTGRVRYKRPGGRWRRVAAGGIELPVGSSLDTRRGRIALTTALRQGKKQTGTFRGGIMQVRQPRRARGRVDIHLLGGNLAACGRSARSSRVGANAAYTRRERGRHLWGRDRGGRFRTFGRHSQATVRGTVWLTKDTCAGTLTVVKRGAVVVRDLRTHRRVLVKAGHRYFARARR